MGSQSCLISSAENAGGALNTLTARAPLARDHSLKDLRQSLFNASRFLMDTSAAAASNTLAAAAWFTGILLTHFVTLSAMKAFQCLRCPTSKAAPPPCLRRCWHTFAFSFLMRLIAMGSLGRPFAASGTTLTIGSEPLFLSALTTLTARSSSLASQHTASALLCHVFIASVLAPLYPLLGAASSAAFRSLSSSNALGCTFHWNFAHLFILVCLILAGTGTSA